MGRRKRARAPKAPAKKGWQERPLEETNQAIADDPMESRWFAAGDRMGPKAPKREERE